MTDGNKLCNLCGRKAGLFEGTLLDTSGGTFIEICAGCLEQLKRVRCRLCGSADEPSRSEGLVIHNDETADEETHFHVCDDCREAVTFLDGALGVAS